MPAAVVRMDIFFSSQLQGWSEQYYVQAAGGFTEAGVSPLLQIVNERAKLSPYSVQIQGVRIVNVAQPRAAFRFVPDFHYPQASSGVLAGPYSFTGRGTFGSDVAALSVPPADWHLIDAEDPDIGLLIECYDVTLAHHRGMIMRGMPLSIFGDGGIIIYAPVTGGLVPGDGYHYALYNFWSKFNDWISQLTGPVNGVGPLLLRVTTATGVTDPLRIPVLNLTYGGPGNNYILVTTLAPLVFPGAPLSPVGLPVTLRGYKGGYRVNGQWRVASFTPPTAPSTIYTYLLGPHRRNSALDALFPAGVSIQASNYAYPAIASAGLSRRYASEHRTGRPFGAQAGRRAAR